jgi:hypothetical protein
VGGGGGGGVFTHIAAISRYVVVVVFSLSVYCSNSELKPAKLKEVMLIINNKNHTPNKHVAHVEHHQNKSLMISKRLINTNENLLYSTAN